MIRFVSIAGKVRLAVVGCLVLSLVLALSFGIMHTREAVEATVAQWQQDSQRTTYLLDVRSPAEYADSHLAGYRNAPGGQLVHRRTPFDL